VSGTNETHDPALRSWVESANVEGGDFPIQNLPFGVFRRKGSHEPFRGGVAIGAEILDLAAAHKAGLFSGEAAAAAANCSGAALNAFMAMGPTAWAALRLALSRTLRTGSSHTDKLRGCLVPQAQAEYAVPAEIGDYTDFFTSIHHATNVGKLFRPDNPLLPNYKWVPIGYHGRGSSIGVSGQSFPRPQGQKMPPGAAAPVFGPSKRLDYELEIGIYIGTGNALGQPIPIAEAERHVFGLGLLNDWSARDIQAWEYQPLGPFLAKSFATTVSPWIVTLEALAPFRCPVFPRPPEDPQPLPYLFSEKDHGYDIAIEMHLKTRAMRSPARVSRSSFRDSYWTVAQMVAHQSSNGCNLQPGDLLGSGTISGAAPGSAGSMMELSQAGRTPIGLPGGETRSFLEDGDEVIQRGRCRREGCAPIGFGEASGRISPARSSPG